MAALAAKLFGVERKDPCLSTASHQPAPGGAVQEEGVTVNVTVAGTLRLDDILPTSHGEVAVAVPVAVTVAVAVVLTVAVTRTVAGTFVPDGFGRAIEQAPLVD